MKRRSESSRALLLSLALGASSAPACAQEAAEPDRRWALPDKLREISGLALTSDQRLLAVTDELAIVYELDYDEGRLVKAFALGAPVVSGDFEGIAVLHDEIWLMTSDGVLYAAVEGGDGERVDFTRHATPLQGNCEFEGLASVRSRDALLLICKRPKARLFEWTPTDGRTREIDLQNRKMAKAARGKVVNPSGVATDPSTGELVILAAEQRTVLRLTAAGEFIGLDMRLHKRHHPQAEGIVVTPDGRLLIADEAAGGSAQLAIYPPLRRASGR